MPTTPANEPHPEHRDSAAPLHNRREFLRQGTRTVGAGIATLVLCDLTELMDMAAAAGMATSSAEAYDWNDFDYVYLVDIRKCIGCGACVRACSQENNVPPHHFRTWVERYHVSRDPREAPVVDSPNGAKDGFKPMVVGEEVSKAFFFPKLCCHCTYTPCVQLCPVGASYRTPDGVILVDEKRCIGCGYCVQACPYGSRFIHPKDHVASKCTLCYHRLRRGLKPACVQACPVRARLLGNRKDPRDEVAEIIATQSVRILQPELLTEPNCYYLGLSGEAR